MTGIFARLCSAALFRWRGWTLDISVPRREKCIIAVAPHTSNWDFIVGEAFNAGTGLGASFLMKRGWFRWPLGALLRKLGGIPVERSRHVSLTDQLAREAAKRKRFVVAVTPEGTRSRNDNWKRGFYYIALKAGIPIQLYALDFKHKRIVCHKEMMPSGDVEADMRVIGDYYAEFADCALRPEKFAAPLVNSNRETTTVNH